MTKWETKWRNNGNVRYYLNASMKSHRSNDYFLIYDLPSSKWNITLFVVDWLNRIQFWNLFRLRFWWFYRGQNEIYTTRSTIASFVKELNQNYNMTFSQAKRLCSPLYQHISTSALVCVCIQKQGLCRNFCHGGLPRGTLWQITFSYEIFNIFRCINFIR